MTKNNNTPDLVFKPVPIRAKYLSFVYLDHKVEVVSEDEGLRIIGALVRIHASTTFNIPTISVGVETKSNKTVSLFIKPEDVVIVHVPQIP